MIESAARDDVRELERRLRPYLARRVARSSDVDDVLQDVLLRVLRGASSLRDDERFGPWVYRVARNAVIDHARAESRPSARVGADPDGLASAEIEDPVEAEFASFVAPFVAALPSPYREALTLTELQGLTQREAAEMLGTTLSTMKSRVQRGRVRLREALEVCCRIATDSRGRVIDFECRAGGCAPNPPGSTDPGSGCG